ncbi:non-canonical purine NTP pyrophosphatase, RdgB/HAM1 family [Deinococcus irradiatisoli]|uniref:dITP/XTP pyrophosphatase n=1 Tax=Deinococcus irradiatisoli TaxID=2202254 RepID=A0A2Z3JDD0_9DEIO|nr:RdgB/HAM1 family non-canonical purine NTP pyrophosphatase [Deinococcus irradiatisoli]AWN23183.1 non-canonical purine NTP pyrophosphatase, RdgB/HAM1 family [Deinococcus irradiatisoli]
MSHPSSQPSSALNRVVVATSNPGKVKEFQEALADLGWQLEPLGNLTMPEETGSTYAENAMIKAAAISMQTGLPALADDSGLEVAGLGGEPGIYSARFGGRRDDHERNLYLLERTRNMLDRRARFVSVVVLAYPDGHLEEYRGEVQGTLLEGPRGVGGFGYDPLFALPDGRSLAQLSLSEKRAVSHRGKALAALKAAHRNGPPPRPTGSRHD